MRFAVTFAVRTKTANGVFADLWPVFYVEADSEDDAARQCRNVLPMIKGDAAFTLKKVESPVSPEDDCVSRHYVQS